MDNLWIIHGQSIVYCCNHSSLPKRSQEDIESMINHHLIFFGEVMNFQRALHVGIHFDNKKGSQDTCGKCSFSTYVGSPKKALASFQSIWEN